MVSRKKPHLRLQDPYLERERSTYSNPLPSREFIFQIIAERKTKSIRLRDLMQMLEITSEEELLFFRRIKAMLRDGQMIKKDNKLIVIDKSIKEIRDKTSRYTVRPARTERRFESNDILTPPYEAPRPNNHQIIIQGTVHTLSDGTGKVIAESDQFEMFLDAREMMQVFHGDVVKVSHQGSNRQNKASGKIIEIVERVNHSIVGRLHVIRENIFYVIAEDRKVHLDITIPYEYLNGAEVDQVVEVKITQQPTLYSKPVGKITKIIGNYGDSGIEIEIALRKHQLPFEFSKQTLSQVKQLKKLSQTMVDPEDIKQRVDLRDIALVTIDGETSRDFDDAVFARSFRSGYKLYVAIADVSHYVKPKEALDVDAYDRGTSVYFPRRVIPMLPEVLSNGLCSLNPNVERLCMVCEMNITSKGEINIYKFYPAVMKSYARLTYTQVANYLKNPTESLGSKVVDENINDLYKVFEILNEKRKLRGALDFDAPELQMNFNDNGKIESIDPVIRNDAHRLIEECMLAANVCAAKFIDENDHQGLYRIHDVPDVERIEKLRAFVGEFGLKLLGKDKPTTKHFAKLVEKSQDLACKDLINTVILRTMQQAMYSPDNIGHFGLAYDFYTHFTSPIRRYPDLLVHRTIKAILNQETYHPHKDWVVLGEHCSMTERRATEASWDVEAWLKCFYMQDKISEVFMGTISSVTSFGLFITLDDIHIEGLVHISELGRDYFIYDASKHMLIGDHTRKMYRLGDRICVKVVRVDLDETKIDLILHRED